VLGPALKSLSSYEDPNLLVGPSTADDAGVYLIRSDLALVQTVDFFTPVVDDPYLFGKIAAANSLSDIYAMGAKPLTCLNTLMYPEKWGSDPLIKILSGGQDKINEAGALLLGGHTVNDSQLKYGLCVTGTVHPKELKTNAMAREGDALILTKPLGTGLYSTALKSGKCSEEDFLEVIESMATLNAKASEIALKYSCHGMTDITGFGFLGHANELAKASEVSLEIIISQLPLFPKALEFAKEGFLTKGDKTNRLYTAGFIEENSYKNKLILKILYDPQTSGGLLFSLPKEYLSSCLGEFSNANLAANHVGSVIPNRNSTKIYLK